MKRGPTGRAASRGVPTRRTADPRGRRGGRLTLEGPWTCRGVPAGDYKPRAALISTLFFSAKTDMPPKLTYFLALLQLAKRLCPFKLYRDSVPGGMVNSKSYFTVVKILCAGTSWVTDLSPGPTTCDTERRSPAHPPSGSRPQG